MTTIHLPVYPWFARKHEGHLVTNTFSGSIRLNPALGGLHTKTFHYRVRAEISDPNEGTFRIIAETYVLPPWKDGNEKAAKETKNFEGSEEGIRSAEAWIAHTASKHGC